MVTNGEEKRTQSYLSLHHLRDDFSGLCQSEADVCFCTGYLVQGDRDSCTSVCPSQQGVHQQWELFKGEPFILC